MDETSTPEAVISFARAVKDYGTKEIGPVTFSVGRGEIVGFLGPNGSGKSTTIRMLLGLITPTSGVVRLMQRDPLKDHVRALEHVGYSPELPNLQSFLTPKELLRLTAKELGMGREATDAQLPVLLEQVGLINYQDYKIAKLSKGMVQRLSVAQAMMGAPKVLILDEPMIGIDPAGVVQFRSLFRSFVKDGGTIVMSSHILSEVESLCTSLVVIHSGKMVFRGGIDEFIRQMLSSRTVLVELDPPAPGPSLAQALASIPGVAGVSPSPEGLVVEVARGADPRAEIARAVVGAGGRLVGLRYSRSELDEAYIAAIRGPAQ
ncbi:MAG: ABC transporter ATP-binding protein [Nitrososphaerota archaeon]|nr:ABC transporter ATP-binding protein [Nitrososphaerota archaeon]MDG7021579.1 ABC transporter ATP-binding protein [Nitrososphaerota archaeon]